MVKDEGEVVPTDENEEPKLQKVGNLGYDTQHLYHTHAFFVDQSLMYPVSCLRLFSLSFAKL